MPYVKTPWVALKNDDIQGAINEALSKVNTNEDIKAAYAYMNQNADVAKRIREHLLKNTELGEPGFYHTLSNNWEALPDKLKTELKNKSALSDTPPEYLLNYGCKYETVFANTPTDPLDHLGFTFVGSLWRDTSLSNLHFTFTHFAEENPALFATLMLYKKGQDYLKDYAFATHPAAYIAGGFTKITMSDIFSTLEITIEELGSTESLGQVLKILQTSMEKMNPLKAFLNSHLLKPKGVIGRDRRYIKAIIQELIKPNIADKSGEYFYNFFQVNVPEESRERVPQPENIATTDDVINYVEKLVSEFSPLIAGVGDGLFKTLFSFFGRINRIIDRVKFLAREIPEEIVDLVISIFRKITGVPSPILKATRHVHQSIIKMNRINQNE